MFLFFPRIAPAINLTVDRVYDGDTIKAVGHDIEIKVRLIGIDAPETPKGKDGHGQPFGEEAKQFLATLVLNKEVEIKGYGFGPYNRIIGEVFIGDKNVNLEMIKAGMAEVYKGKPPRGFNLSWYYRYESEARIAGRGMWSLQDSYISPAQWRAKWKK